MELDRQLDGWGGFASFVMHDPLYDLERLFRKIKYMTFALATLFELPYEVYYWRDQQA